MEDFNNLDYTTLTHLRSAFQRAGGRSQIYTAKDFDSTDTPGWNYFKILFDFNSPFLSLECNEDADLNPNDMSLIDDDKINITNKQIGHRIIDGRISRAIPAGEFNPNIVIKNTAYNYLLLNCEFERAELLRQFVQLLSNINTQSPWYFQEINGMGEAVARPELLANEFKPVGDEVKNFTIKCLPDAIDARIGTLLDLYKAICFSQTLHKEIVPANLRKFDMSIYIFNTKIGFSRKRFNWSELKYEDVTKGLHIDASFEQNNQQSSYDTISKMNDSNVYVTSSKLFSFHNCEFDPNSNNSAFSTLSNAEGWQNEYTIRILFDNAFEQRYNEYIQRFIGDMIAWDINYKLNASIEMGKYSNIEANTENLKSALKTRLNLDADSNLLTKLGNVAEDVIDSAAALALGNIYYTNILTNPNSAQNFESRWLNRGEELLTSQVRELGIKTGTGIKSLFNGDKQERRENRANRIENKKLNKSHNKSELGNDLSINQQSSSQTNTGTSMIGTNLRDH